MSTAVEVSTCQGLCQVCGYATAASWIAMVWEWLISLDDEVTFIWPMANTAYVKWLYLFAKYFALTIQTGVASLQVFYLTNHSMSTENCRIYRALEMTAVTFLMLCFDVVLLLRIYALYGRHAWSCVFATCAVLIELLTTIASMVAAIPTMMYDSACIMIEIPKSIIVFVVGTFASQAVLLWLAYRKRDRVVRPRASIACVTIRDGLLVFVCFAVFLVIVFVLILHDSPMTSVTIFFLPMLISLATCRLIINLQHASRGGTTHQFTTEIWGLDGSADSFLLANLPFPSPRSY